MNIDLEASVRANELRLGLGFFYLQVLSKILFNKLSGFTANDS